MCFFPNREPDHLNHYVKELIRRYPDLNFSMIESLLHMRSDLEKKVFKKCIEEIKLSFVEHEKTHTNLSLNEKRSTTNTSSANVSSSSELETKTSERQGILYARKQLFVCMCDHYLNLHTFLNKQNFRTFRNDCFQT
jgi:hypothetical protein